MLSPIYKHKRNVKVPKKLTSSLLIDIELHLEDLIMGFFWNCMCTLDYKFIL